ncbi:hypothetical protein JKL49_12940 [Phenylobacterium sp. 20VBR1]|uniref:Uncharacterized protein n=1 Tax=Phenylobacterium glaciei TaxID=2803784 RepID=A0A941D3T0_9CAUL|nr:hypothetical protein [Phenylobacterium glaciei]MBR7620293.1 hypothetical protein [Phenylobacterium glaciei]
MTLYHLFVTDPRGAVLQHLAVDGESDEDLLAQIPRYDDGHDIEIWDGERLVAIYRGRKGP